MQAHFLMPLHPSSIINTLMHEQFLLCCSACCNGALWNIGCSDWQWRQ